MTRRTTLATAVATALARPSLIRAQTVSTPIRIGVLSDVAGPYRNVGGPGAKIAVELAVEDFGGSLIGRAIEVVQTDIQNKPDISSAKAREWIDNGFNVLVDGGATSSGLAVQEVARAKKTIYLGNGPSATDLTGKFCSPYGFHFWADYIFTRQRNWQHAYQGRWNDLVLHYGGLPVRLLLAGKHRAFYQSRGRTDTWRCQGSSWHD